MCPKSIHPGGVRNGGWTRVRQLSPVMPILQIAAILLLNPVSVTAGILSLIFANDPEVKAYFATQDQSLPPAPTTPTPTTPS